MEWTVGVAVPVLLALGAGVGGILMFFVRVRLEEIRAAEERLSGERRKVYGELLLPYVQLFTPSREKAQQVLPPTTRKESRKQQAEPDHTEQAMARILSVEYRQTAFDLMLIASDDVVRAYNDLMQFTFRMVDADPSERSWEVLSKMGQLLLEIRRSLGIKDTELTNVDMLRFMITDIEKLEDYQAQRGKTEGVA